MSSPFSYLGSHILALGFPCALFSLLAFIIGYKQNRTALVDSARRATLLTFVFISVCVFLLISAFVSNDFSILYVHNYSSAELPIYFKITGLWAGLDGSILFWVWLVSLYSVIVLFQNYKKNADWMPYINAVFMVIILFFLAMILFANNPFALNPETVTDGKGLNPLLQNIAMTVHPPSLYLGYTGFAVPFAFVVAALITRRLDFQWIEDSRRWTLIAWFFLTLGNILGSAWAYVELGWGGFWAWDPVENAAIMPWFTASAYIHSVLIQKKRGMLMVWNTVLISLTFILTMFGTFLTRSGVVQSVHAFSDSKLGPYFLAFIIAAILISAYLIVSRLKDLKSKNTFQSYFSKESAFLLNNVVLLVCSLSIMWGTLFPSISEWIVGERVTVGPPFFNKIMAPMGLTLLALMGIGPMISWKKASVTNLRNNLVGPILVGLGVALIFLFVGIKQWYVNLSTFLISFVFFTILLEVTRGVRATKIQKKSGILPAFVDLIKNNNRRYGGYLVHVGILFIFAAIAGAVFKGQADFTLKPGQSYTYDAYRFDYVKMFTQEDSHRAEVGALVDVYRDNKKITTLKPARNFYFKSEQPSTEASIYHAPLEDVYLIIGAMDENSQNMDFRLTIHPLINFLWLGGFVILMGSVLVILPRGLRIRKTVEVGLLLLVLLPASGFAQNIQDEDAKYLTEQKKVTETIRCMCDCVRQSLDYCTCSNAAAEKAEILKAIKEGATAQSIIDSYIAKYGTEAYIQPPRQGFLNWGYWIPSIVLIIGFLVGGIAIRRMNSHVIKIKPKDIGLNQDEYANKLKKELEEYDDN